MYPGAHLSSSPDKAAVIMAATGRTITYQQLEDRSVQVSHYLRELGLSRGDHIAVVSTNEPEVFVIYWAAMRSGLLITMVNSHLTAPEIAYIVDDSQARVVIFSASLADKASDRHLVEATGGVRWRLGFGGHIPGHTDLDEAIADLPTAPPAHEPRGADMLYSSGTTGAPKGVAPALPDRQVGEPGDTVTALAQSMWTMDGDSVYLSPAPLYHAAPLRTSAAVQALGGTVVVMDRFDPEAALEIIDRYRITHSQWVPTMFVRMLKLPAAVRDAHDLSSMEVAIHAAAPCPVEVKRAMIDWWGPILMEYYSATELNGMSVIDSREWLEKPGSVGRAVLGRIRICDESGNELPAGHVGVVYFERDVPPFEYHNDPDKTARSRHPEHPEWTTTGDLGRVDEDGYLFLADRQSFVIISGGVNIYPQEIEDLLTMHPDVLDVAVVGEPDEEMGESVLALIETTSGHHDVASVERSLRELVTGSLAGFKHPRRYAFVDELPRTPTGKLAKHRIKL